MNPKTGNSNRVSTPSRVESENDGDDNDIDDAEEQANDSESDDQEMIEEGGDDANDSSEEEMEEEDSSGKKCDLFFLFWIKNLNPHFIFRYGCHRMWKETCRIYRWSHRFGEAVCHFTRTVS